MSIPQHLVDQLMVACARCCCICRRLQPMRLQVHHIIEQSEGGDDTVDNLIVVCLTCHSDIHTATKLTRRFTVNELRLHRSSVLDLVAKGLLPAGPPHIQSGVAHNSDYVAAVLQQPSTPLGSLAISLLLEAAASESPIAVRKYASGVDISISDRLLVRSLASARVAQDHEAAITELRDRSLIRAGDHSQHAFYVTTRGYLLADQLATAAARDGAP